MARPLTEYVAKSPAFAGELARLRRGGTRREPVVFDRVCPAAFSFVSAMVAAQAGTPRRIWVVADALPVQERVAAEWGLWESVPAVFIPERETHINNGLSDPDLAAERLEALKRISGAPREPQAVLVTAAGLRQAASPRPARSGYNGALTRSSPPGGEKKGRMRAPFFHQRFFTFSAKPIKF